ncbi:Vacuolar protein sorting-associated protein 68 [Coniosporium tulheliwenetii]|uniref:Vacuolar protein sorting-associated protein 68 n=1 Tax=Coniosporium tulheliwenetii TaxID=3383036 RepID=A0ACC2Z304_9PEZI|nr:Vacuolar protein sorting-associated protein 68 [Cladosporium sp. JES 115]
MASHRLFRFPKPQWLNSANTRTAGVYLAGALVYSTLPSPSPQLPPTLTHPPAVLSRFLLLHRRLRLLLLPRNGSSVHITFVDWIPGICSALGMLVINSIDKSRLAADSFSYSGNGVAWKARLVLFLGFALMAGGLAGSVTVMVLKYVVPEYPWPTLWFGVANVVANACIMLSSVVLWVSQNMEDEYTYNLAL